MLQPTRINCSHNHLVAFLPSMFLVRRLICGKQRMAVQEALVFVWWPSRPKYANCIETAQTSLGVMLSARAMGQCKETVV